MIWVSILLYKTRGYSHASSTNPVIKHKVGLLNLAEELGNVSKACKIMHGVSRDTFTAIRNWLRKAVSMLWLIRNRRVPNMKNRVDEATERAVVEYVIAFPAYGQHWTSNELRKKRRIYLRQKNLSQI